MGISSDRHVSLPTGAGQTNTVRQSVRSLVEVIQRPEEIVWICFWRVMRFFYGFDFTMGLHPGRLTWNLKMIVWKIIFRFNWVIFRFYIILPGCIQSSPSFTTICGKSSPPFTTIWENILGSRIFHSHRAAQSQFPKKNQNFTDPLKMAGLL